ncbi:ATP-binding protein [Chitinibacter sp. SCUT-21]|uniref:PAS domain-containing hybrid sensor histidine kinase/response regulator n=1 Tax=Chitinibacter sp. SCUT-21 TaxID=2970891 RepID=UPI0035A6310C
MIAPQLLSDYCATAILAVNPQDESIVACNPACETLLGYTSAQLIGLKISEIEVGLQDVFFWEDVRNSGVQEVFQVEGEYRHRNGHFIFVSKTIRIVQQDGQTLCIISANDISANKRLEDESARTSALLSATLESTADGILVCDLNGNVINYNHRLGQIWPWHANNDPSLHRQLEEFKAQLCDRSGFEQWLALLFHDPYIEEQNTFKLYDDRVFEISSCPLQYRDAPIGRLFCVHDISSLKATEAALREARDIAMHASKAKSDFLAHMSHELRTPLNAILGFAQVIEADESASNHILGGYIHKAGQHLLGLINEVLDLASIEAGKMALQLESVDTIACINDCLQLTEVLSKDKGITLQITPPSEPCFIWADGRRLKQMLLNLISNAIKYNRPHGSVNITLEHRQNECWRINVQDTGMGISEDDQRQLFMAFNRVGNAQSSIEGTGIGLAFTKKLAQIMHGAIGMSSELNVGSCFWIELPASAAPSPANAHQTIAISQGAQTILYIEDDLLSQKLIQNILASQRPDYQVFVAKTAQEGIGLAKQLMPDLILLDQQLPDGSGQMIFEQLRKNERTRVIPCIALSGNTLPEQIDDALRLGFCAYLSKPIQISQALLTIDQVLREHSKKKT